MPAAPKSPVQKKAGAPKAKGAVRAKSGCYTCRIRRKKCDEKPNHNNACETCVRLRLECLGFGAKRPEWLRESSKVSDLREKIKNFLASQGMIKGHSGSGPRGTDAEPVVLRLNEQDYSSSSESPQSNILTLSSSAEDFRPLHHTSAMRDENWNTASSFTSQLRHSPPPYNTPYTFDPNNASTSLVPWNPMLAGGPTSASSFSPLYHLNFDAIDMDDPIVANRGFNFSYDVFPDILLDHYKKNVIGVQYLLADSSEFHNIIFSTVDTDGPSRDSARLLAQIHTIRSQSVGQPALLLDGVKEKYDTLKTILNQKHFNDNDAMASLHLISSFLFDGGSGEWEEWLKVACSYCEQLLAKHDDSIVTALFSCNVQQQFLLKTTIWFDVLASITTLKSPHLLLHIRELCSPNVSSIYDPTAAGTPPELSMMSVMGCENSVVWALAETSALSAWKRAQEAQGRLSMPELVTKSMDISRYLGSPPSSPRPSVLHASVIEGLRCSTAEIFHASARIYLASVVSGDYVFNPEISGAVDEFMDCVERIPSTLDSPGAVVRSTVFSFFIGGALTDSQANRQRIIEYLGSIEGPGNCRTVQCVLEEIWNSRASKKRSEPVPWRKTLHSHKLLLV